MTARYASHVSPKHTPQSEPLPGSSQVPNSAGGYSFAVDDWSRLDRFLILGAEGGSYYASERKLTQENAQAVLRCLSLDGARTINRALEVSEQGKAPKNAPAVFVLALALCHGTLADKALVRQLLPGVARIPTDLFSFVSSCQEMRGWGPALRKAVAHWYESKELRPLAYQMAKYQQRDGWSHKDLLRLSHTKAPAPRTMTLLEGGKRQYQDQPTDNPRAILYRWALRGWDWVGDQAHPNADLHPVWAMEKARRATSKQEVVRLIRDYDLVRECIPTEWLNEAEVWEALLAKMPLNAMVRNLAKMTAVGLLAPLSQAVRKVCDELADVERIRKARLHPIAILSALKVYAQGHGDKGKLSWTPVQQVADALDRAFYASFQTVTPTGKRHYLAFDVSGSMWCGNIAGVPGLTPGIAAAAMGLVTANVEPSWYMACFNTTMLTFGMSPQARLDEVASYMRRLPWGGTDCAQPMIHALHQKIPVDVFCVYTDSETWAGSVHPVQVLREYRQKMGIPARLVVVGMVSNGFTIADPADGGMLDCVGFDTSTPGLIADFARG